MTRYFLVLAVIVGCLGAVSKTTAAAQDCVVVLWGDGKHDDTAALNAWLRGADAVWGDSGKPVGPTIIGRSFRLSSAIYVRAGTGRTIRDFRMEWPERGEIVSGGMIEAGADPDTAPVLSAVSIVGGDPGEGIPFEMPDDGPENAHRDASCATS